MIEEGENFRSEEHLVDKRYIDQVARCYFGTFIPSIVSEKLANLSHEESRLFSSIFYNQSDQEVVFSEKNGKGFKTDFFDNTAEAFRKLRSKKLNI